MPQSLAQVYLHIVFSTKRRAEFLAERDVRQRMHAYLGGVCRDLGCPALGVGGVADHVHLLCQLSRTITIADLVRDVKRASSKWVKAISKDLSGFDWQDGYGAFGISPAHVPVLLKYIENQEE